MDWRGQERTQFQSATNLEQKGVSKNGLKALENGGRGWV